MAEARVRAPVRFLAGILAADARALAAARTAAARAWGEPDLESGVLPFTATGYYAEETGPAILRAFLSFPAPFEPEALAGRKLEANALERELAASLGGWPRPVNLDPGYLAPDKLVLASCKDFPHRLCIGSGVFAEVTLVWRRERFEPMPWTFPDYAGGAYDSFLREARVRLMAARPARSRPAECG